MLGESGWSRPVPLPLWPLLLHVAEGVWAQQTVQQYWHCRVGWRICTQSKPVLKLQRKYTLTPAPSSVTQAYQSLDLFPFTLPLLNTLTSATLTLSLNFHRRRMGCRTATLSWLYICECVYPNVNDSTLLLNFLFFLPLYFALCSAFDSQTTT